MNNKEYVLIKECWNDYKFFPKGTKVKNSNKEYCSDEYPTFLTEDNFFIRFFDNQIHEYLVELPVLEEAHKEINTTKAGRLQTLKELIDMDAISFNKAYWLNTLPEYKNGDIPGISINVDPGTSFHLMPCAVKNKEQISFLYTDEYHIKPILISDDIKLCEHSWKSYVGFTQAYEYCEKCNIKNESKI